MSRLVARRRTSHGLIDDGLDAYSAVVMADAPDGYWRLGDSPLSTSTRAVVGPNLAANLDGNGNSLVAFGQAPLIAFPDTAAGFNGDLAGSGSALTVDSPAGGIGEYAGTQPFAVEAWVVPTALVAGGGRIARRLDDAGQYGWRLWADDTGVKFTRFTPTGSNTAIYSTPLTIGGTIAQATEGPPLLGAFALGTVPDSAGGSLGAYHVMAIYDGTQSILVLNGSQVAVRADTNAIPSAHGTLNVGGGPSNTWSGSMDEVVIYGHALTIARAKAHYDAGGVPSTGGGTPPPPAVTFGAALQDWIANSGYWTNWIGEGHMPDSTGSVVSVNSTATLNTAINAAVDGAIIELASGTYTNINLSGKIHSPTNPVTIRAAVGATVHIQTTTGANHAWFMTNCQGFKIVNLVFDYAAYCAIKLDTSVKDIEIVGCSFTLYGQVNTGHAVLVDYLCERIALWNCKTFGGGDHGLYLGSQGTAGSGGFGVKGLLVANHRSYDNAKGVGAASGASVSAT